VATIYPRGTCWYLNWSENGNQRRKSLGEISEHEADTQRRAKELELRTGKRIFIASRVFDEHRKTYLAWHRSEFPDSHYRVEQIASQHFGAFEGKPLSQIQNTDIELWKAARVQVVSRESVGKEFRTLKALLQKAVEWGEIEKNPAEYVEEPRSLESAPIHWYTKPQLAKLYERHHGQTWKFLANTGLRRTEAKQLRVDRVDFKRKVVTIVSTAGARTKSGKWREIPLSDNAIAAAQALIAEHGKTGFVLPRIASESLSRAFLKDVARLGLGGSLHSLRHSYGAHLVMAGVPLRSLQVLMGHASFRTTERYAHVGKDHLRAKARRINL